MNNNSRFENLLIRIVPKPGVYIMKNAAGIVLYIGKAKNLRQRVRQYFRKSHDNRWFIEHLKEQVHDIETITTENESEALLLESTLIKKHKPLFNVYFRDDKSFQKLVLTTSEQYPRLLLTRQVREDKNRYFGPYAGQGNIKELYRFLQKNFPLRKCRNTQFKNRRRPCLYYEMNQCLGPCCFDIPREEYQDLVHQIIAILEGCFSDLKKKFTSCMWNAAQETDFEKAARYRELLQALNVIAEKQNVELLRKLPAGNYHFWNYAFQDHFLQIQNLIFSEGHLIASQTFHYDNVYQSPEEPVISFLAQYYSRKKPGGKCRLVLPVPLLHESDHLQTVSSNLIILKRYRKVFKEVLQLAYKNASEQLEGYLQSHQKSLSALKELQDRFPSKKNITYIECYDISHLGGDHTVGVKVSFRRGVPEKSHYRIYNIYNTGGDDTRALKEVFMRRLKKSSIELEPDIILVDGGKQQLNILEEARKDTSSTFIPLAIAKERLNKERTDTLYSIFPDGSIQKITFSDSTHYFLQRIRDEAHRFARQSMQRRHKKEQVSHPILKIPGIGKKKLNIILQHFHSTRELKKATPEQIKQINTLSAKDIDNILQYRDNL